MLRHEFAERFGVMDFHLIPSISFSIVAVVMLTPHNRASVRVCAAKRWFVS